MNKYVIFLRGINVSGQKKIKMAELREYLSSDELQNVATYIQSGNIMVSSALDKKEVQKEVEQKIKHHYGYHVPSLVLNQQDLQSIISQNPFVQNEKLEEKNTYYCLFFSSPSADLLNEFSTLTYPNETYALGDSTAYLQFFAGAAKAKMGNNLIERKLNITATTRNFNTMMKMLQMFD